MPPKRKPTSTSKKKDKPRLGCPKKECPGELQRCYLNQSDALQCNSCQQLYLVGPLCVIPVVLTET